MQQVATLHRFKMFNMFHNDTQWINEHTDVDEIIAISNDDDDVGFGKTGNTSEKKTYYNDAMICSE